MQSGRSCDTIPRRSRMRWPQVGRWSSYRSGQRGENEPGVVTTEEASMDLLYFLIVGLVAGWLAGKVMKGGGYGVVVDIILGILGGIVGGWIFGVLGIWPGGGIIGAIVVAFVGAVVLVWITRVIRRA